MEQLTSNLNFIQKSYSIRNNSSIRLQRKSLVSQSKSLNQAVFIMEYQKVMQMIQSKPDNYLQGIQILYPLIQRCNQIKSSKTKLYYIKQNIMITLIKLLNKQGDQLRILHYFNLYMPDMMKQAKFFQAKKGNIIMMIILWAKCCYSIQKYDQALNILQKTSGFIQMFQSAKLINLMKISFLKAKIYQQQNRTEDYENQIVYAYHIVKSNNILSTLGLKITQLYHNIKLNDKNFNKNSNKSRKQSFYAHRVNRSFSKQKQNKGVSNNNRQSLQAYPRPSQSKFLQRTSKGMSFINRNSHSNTSNNLSSQKDRPRGSSIDFKKMSSSGKSSNIKHIFQDIKRNMIPSKQKRSTFILESQITSQLNQLGHYKQNSQIERSNSILKRPQYKKYSFCQKSHLRFNDHSKPQVIQQQAKDTQREQQDYNLQQLDILSRQGRNKSRRTSRMNINIQNDQKQINQQECILNITPLKFPTQYNRQNDERDESFHEPFNIQLNYSLSFWGSQFLLSIKKIIIEFDYKQGIHFKVYFHNTLNVIVIKIPYCEEQKMTKQYFCEYLQTYFKVKYDDEQISNSSNILDVKQQQKLKQISRILVRKHISSKIVAPLGRIYQIQTRHVKFPTKKQYQVKDRLRYDIPRQARKSRKSCHFRKIVSDSQLVQIVQRTYFNMYEIMQYQIRSVSIIDEIVQNLPYIMLQQQKQAALVNTQQSQQKLQVSTLIPLLKLQQSFIKRQLYTGRYTFKTSSIDNQKGVILRNIDSSTSREIFKNIFQNNSSNQVRQFYQMIKYDLIMQERKQSLLQYFQQTSIESIFSIQGIGTCKIQLAYYYVKDIYQKDFVFFKFQIIPVSSKTKKIKFVITKQDIQHYLNIKIPKIIIKDDLFNLLKEFKTKFLYIKDALYSSLVLNTKQYFGYNKFVFYQYEHMNNPKHFLTLKLKDVKILKQKTVKIEVEGKKAFIVLTVQHLKGNDLFKILIYVPVTNRRLQFSLPRRILDELNNKDQNNNIDWNGLLSTMKFGTLQSNTLIAKIASYSYLVIQSHFASFGKVNNYVFHVCFKVFNKKYPQCHNFLSQVQNIILNQLSDYQVYLQLNWLKNSRKLCYVFSIVDFIELVLSLPRKKKIHSQLECVYFNLADIRLMLSIGYEQIVASLMEFNEDELQQLVQRKSGKYKLHRLIEQNLKKISKNRLISTDRRIKSSMNSLKTRSRQDYLDIIHKGLYRFKEKNIIGIFNNNKNKNFVIKTYNKQEVGVKQISFKEIFIPFAGEKKHQIAKQCNNRIMKMIKNKLICSSMVGKAQEKGK